MISTQTNETIPTRNGPENNDEDEAAVSANLALNSNNNINSTSNDTKPSSDDKSTKLEDAPNSTPTKDSATNIKPEFVKSTTPQSASSSNSTSSCSRQSNNNIRTTMGKFKEKRPEPLKLNQNQEPNQPLDLSIKSAGNVPSGTHIFNLSSASKLTTLETPRIVWQENETLLTNKARLFSSSTGGSASQRVRLSSLAGDSPPITPSTPFTDLIYSPTIVRSAGLMPHCSTTSLFSNHGDSTSSLQAAFVLQHRYQQSRQFVEENFLNKTISSPPSSTNGSNKHRLPVLLGTGQKIANNSDMIKAAAMAVSSSTAITPRRSCSTEGLSGLFSSHTFHQTHRYLQQQHQYNSIKKGTTPKSGGNNVQSSARFSYNSTQANSNSSKSPTNKSQTNQSAVEVSFNNAKQTAGSGIGNNGQALTPTSVANATANLLNIHLHSPKANQQQQPLNQQQQDNSISATQVMLNDLLEGNCSVTSGGKSCSINNDQNTLDPLLSAAYCQQHQNDGRISFSSSSSSSTYSTLPGLHDNHHNQHPHPPHHPHHQDNNINSSSNSKLSQSSGGSGCGMTNHHMSPFSHHQQTTPTSLTSNGLASLSSSTTLNTPTLISPSQLKAGSICFLPSPTLSPMSSVFELPSPLLMFPPPPMTNTSMAAGPQPLESPKSCGSTTNTNIINQTTTTTTTTSPSTTSTNGNKLISSSSFTCGTKIMSDPALTSSSSATTAIASTNKTGTASTSTTTTSTSTIITNRPNEQPHPNYDVVSRTTSNQLAQFPVTSSGLTNNFTSCGGIVAAVTSKLTGSEVTLSTNFEAKQMLHQEQGFSALSEGNLAHLVTSAEEKVGSNVLGDDDNDNDDVDNGDVDLDDDEVQMETEDREMAFQDGEDGNERVGGNKYCNQNRLDSKQISFDQSKNSFLTNRNRLTDDSRPPASTIPKILVSDCLRHHQQQQQQCCNTEWPSQGSINNKDQQHASDSVFEPEFQSSDINQNRNPNESQQQQQQQQREQRNSVAKRALSPQSFRARVRLYHNERLASSSAPPDVYQGRARSKIKSAINDSCTNLWSTENLCPSVTPIVDQYNRCASVVPDQQSVQQYQQQQSSQQVHQVAIQPSLNQSVGTSGSNHHLHYKPYPDTHQCLGFQHAAPIQYQQQHQQHQPQQHQPAHLHLQQQQQQQQQQQLQQGPSISGSSTILANRSNSAEPTRNQQLFWGSAHLNQDQLAQEQLRVTNQPLNHHQQGPLQQDHHHHLQQQQLHHQQQHHHPQQHEQQQSQHFGTNFGGQRVQSQHLASLAGYQFSSQSAQHSHANFSTSTPTPPSHNLLKPLNTNNNQQQLQNPNNSSSSNPANQHQNHHHHQQQQQQQQHYVSQHQQQSISAGELHRLPMTSCLSSASSNVFTGSSQMLAPQLNQISCSHTHSNKLAAAVAASYLSTTTANSNQARDHQQQRLPIQQQQQHLPMATNELDSICHQSGLEVLGHNPSSFAPNHSGQQVQGHASQSRLLLSNATSTAATTSANNNDHLLCQITQHEHLQQQQQQHRRNRQQRHLDRAISIDNTKNPSFLVSNTTNRTCSLAVTGAATKTCTNTTAGSGTPSTVATTTPTNVLLLDSPSCNSTDNNNNFGRISTTRFRSSSAQPLQTNSSGAVKKYRCDQCLKAFTRSDMLTRHKRLHSGDKPFMCNECRQEFSRSDHLSTHMRTHTGEKPYKCKLCAYSACRKDMITRHMKVHNRSSPTTLESGGAASR